MTTTTNETAVATTEPAKDAELFSVTENTIKSQVEKYKPLTLKAAANDAEFDILRAARLDCRAARCRIENEREAAKAPVTALGKKIDSTAKKLKLMIEPTEIGLKKLEDDYSNAKAREEARIEAERIEARFQMRKERVLAAGGDPSGIDYRNFEDGYFSEWLSRIAEANRLRAEREEADRIERERMEAERIRIQNEQAELNREREQLAKEKAEIAEQNAQIERERAELAEKVSALTPEESKEVMTSIGQGVFGNMMEPIHPRGALDLTSAVRSIEVMGDFNRNKSAGLGLVEQLQNYRADLDEHTDGEHIGHDIHSLSLRDERVGQVVGFDRSQLFRLAESVDMLDLPILSNEAVQKFQNRFDEALHEFVCKIEEMARECPEAKSADDFAASANVGGCHPISDCRQ